MGSTPVEEERISEFENRSMEWIKFEQQRQKKKNVANKQRLRDSGVTSNDSMYISLGVPGE